MNAYKKIKTRVLFHFSIVVVSILFLVFIYFNLKQNILYFKTPSEVFINNDIGKDTAVRVGGMVKEDSLNVNDKEIKFIITDLKNELIVSYSGVAPNLFSEGKGVVAEGKLKDKKFFIADRILAKHDEKYMPPELKDLMKKNVK